MAADSRTCPGCGARVPAEADRCELCGTSVTAASETSDSVEEDSEGDPNGASEEEHGEMEAEATGSSVFCHQCGWENPPGARYCSQCGTELQDLSDASSKGTRPVAADLPGGENVDESEPSSADGNTDEPSGMGRQIGMLVGGALLLVLGLFFVTQWSGQYNWDERSSSEAASAEERSGQQGPSRPMGPTQRTENRELPDLQTLLDQVADSLAGPMTAQIDSLHRRIEQSSGSEKQRRQAELVNLLIGAGHPGRAAVIQNDLADAVGTVDARRRAADLLYRWMQKLQQQEQRTHVLQVARHAAEAYAAVVEQRPNDLDARTRMGEAYLLTNEPMQGIEAINAVLDDDSTFVPALFQKGLALLQINRLDEAVRQFEEVKQYAEQGSPFYQQADRALTVIEKQRGQASGNASSTTRSNP